MECFGKAAPLDAFPGSSSAFPCSPLAPSGTIEVPWLCPHPQRGFEPALEPAPMSTASLLPPLCSSTQWVGAMQSVIPEPVAGEASPAGLGAS